MVRKILAMSLVLVMVLSFTTCVEVEVANSPLAQEIIDGVIEAQGNITTYQLDANMTMDMAAESEGEMYEAVMTMNSTGVIDVENSQMKIEMTMSMAVPGEPEEEMGMEMYLIGDMMYMLMDDPETDPTWVKSEMPAGYWEQMDQIEPQIELLETAQVEVTGSEIVDGTDCYVVEITPNMVQLWQLVLQQTEATGQTMPDVSEEVIQKMFHSFSVKQWIAKDTYLLVKAEIYMSVELTPEDVGFPEEEGLLTMDITMNTLAYNYNQPVSIELPPEAEDAVEMPIGF